MVKVTCSISIDSKSRIFFTALRFLTCSGRRARQATRVVDAQRRSKNRQQPAAPHVPRHTHAHSLRSVLTICARSADTLAQRTRAAVFGGPAK